MMGCDLHCDYCQNCITSQALRDAAAGVGPRDITPEEIVELAAKRDARFVVSTYNEPLITSEWSAEIFSRAKAEGFFTAYVSNGNATPQALDYMRPRLDAFKIDLKTMSDRKYRKLGGVLQHILDSVGDAHARGYWVEVVTLIVPGFNDFEAELTDAAAFVASVSPDIPWHVIAFHKDYRMRDPADTTARHLVRAAELGAAAGLNFVYAGNLPGQVDRWENTYCPHCGRLLIERRGHSVLRDELSASGGLCSGCGAGIPGIWP
jgi:pyruvate formate lyase activating enzyme